MASTADVATVTSEREDPWRAARRRVILAGIAAGLLAILPILAARHLPLLDAPGHESRLAVLRDLFTGKGSDYYDLSSFFLPNIAFDVLGLPLVYLFEPETCGRIIFALTLLLTLSGVVALSRVAIGRWSLVPLFSALLLYNLVTILGFFSYALGLALVPWALAARLLVESWPPIQRTLIGAALGIVLLFCHVFDFAIYAVMVAGFAFTYLIQRKTDLAGAALRVAESLPAAGLFLLMSTGSVPSHHGYEPHLFRAKIFGLFKAVTAGSMTGDMAFVAAALLFALLVLFCMRIRLAAGFLPGLLALAALYLVLPDKLASGSYVDKRMPVAVALMLLGGLDLRVRRPASAAALTGLIALAFTVRQGALTVLWRSFDPLIDKLADALEHTPAGSVIMQVECEPNSMDVAGIYRERQPSLTHLAAMAAFEDSRFVANTWAIRGQQPIQVQSGLLPYYNQEVAFGSSTCEPAVYRTELRQIENLIWAERSSGIAVPPIYFLLIRPGAPGTLTDAARLAASDPKFELYEVRRER
jgi:hypothetical protein